MPKYLKKDGIAHDVAVFAENLVQQAQQGKDDSGVSVLYREGIKYFRGYHAIKSGAGVIN